MQTAPPPAAAASDPSAAHPRSGAAAPTGRRGGLTLAASEGFVATPDVQAITRRAVAYLQAGYPIHLAGPAGTGKTTIAFHVAAGRNRPVSLLHGNDAFGGADLVGKDSGYRKRTTVDNFIHSVLKTDEQVDVNWVDNRLTVACELGHTLIYDEFNRTRPEANNILLSILEEGILNVPKAGGGYLRVHPEFRIIFTSNPLEYAGTHRSADALLDRLVTIRFDHYDADTERRIVVARSGINEDAAAVIVETAREIRRLRAEAVLASGADGANSYLASHRPTIRACIAAGRALEHMGIEADAESPLCVDVLWDVFGVEASEAGESLLDRCEEQEREDVDGARRGRLGFELLLQRVCRLARVRLRTEAIGASVLTGVRTPEDAE